MSSEMAYDTYQKIQKEQYESICTNCGACCGIGDGDPCKNLFKKSNETYTCLVYNNRLGKQKTVSGNSFNCIPIREALKYKDNLPNCSYRKYR